MFLILYSGPKTFYCLELQSVSHSAILSIMSSMLYFCFGLSVLICSRSKTFGILSWLSLGLLFPIFIQLCIEFKT